MKKTIQCLLWKTAYLATALIYPFLYQSVASKIMATYDFRLAAIIVSFLALIGITQSMSQRLAVFCRKRWLIPINGVILAVLLGINIIGWFEYSWFSTTILLCAGISIMDFIIALFQKPAFFYCEKPAPKRYRFKKRRPESVPQDTPIGETEGRLFE